MMRAKTGLPDIGPEAALPQATATVSGSSMAKNDGPFTRSPFSNYFGRNCFTRLVQLRLMTCTKPSMPSSISIKAHGRRFRYALRPHPSWRRDILCIVQSIPGSPAKCRMPREKAALAGGIHISTTHLDLVSPTFTSSKDANPFRPRSFRNVHQPSMPLLEFNERRQSVTLITRPGHCAPTGLAVAPHQATDLASAALKP